MTVEEGLKMVVSAGRMSPKEVGDKMVQAKNEAEKTRNQSRIGGNMENKLYRSRKDRMLFGVCGGLGKFFGIDPTIIRVIFVLLAFTGFGILAYIVIAIIAPLEESQKTTPQGIVEENVTEIKETATKLGNEIRDTFAGKGKESEEEAVKEQMRRTML